jgi:hypothetical protein
MLGGQSPDDFIFTYYLTDADCNSDVNPLALPTMFENMENSHDLYVRFSYLIDGCAACYNFQIETDGLLGLGANAISNVKIYPNPAPDFIIVTFANLAFVELLIRDVQGRTAKVLKVLAAFNLLMFQH